VRLFGKNSQVEGSAAPTPTHGIVFVANFLREFDKVIEYHFPRNFPCSGVKVFLLALLFSHSRLVFSSLDFFDVFVAGRISYVSRALAHFRNLRQLMFDLAVS
jgi:hypothetical protein